MISRSAEVGTICPECSKEPRIMKCRRCRGKGVKGLFSKHPCPECSGTGTMALCLNTGCNRFDKRLVGWFYAQQRGFR
jgi:hypothetical protein